jgi:hypothetical protein
MRHGNIIFKCIIFLALLMAGEASAGHKKIDKVTTADGSVLIGEIKGVQLASLSLKTDAAGTLSIEWRHVTGLQSKFEYRIELAGGVVHFGSLGPPGKEGGLSIISESGKIDVGLSEVFEISPIEHGFWQRLDGSVNLGFSYTQSNNAVQFNSSGDVSYRSRKNYGSLSGQSIFSDQDEGDATNQHYLQFIMVQAAKKEWGTFELGQVQSNPDQGYNQRYVLGGGTSNFLLESSHQFLGLILGAVYNRENVTDSSEVDNSAEGIAGITFQRFKRSSHSPKIQFSLQTFPSLTDSSRWRAQLNFSISWKVIKDFQFSFQVTDSYDSKPPGEDSANNDMSVVTSFGYTF